MPTSAVTTVRTQVRGSVRTRLGVTARERVSGLPRV